MKKIILALACGTLFASCVKEDDKKIIDVSKSSYLMDGKWQLRAATWLSDINDPAAIPADVYLPMPACAKDNVYIFSTASDVTDYENVKCQLTQPDSVALKYSLTSDDKYLKIWSNPDDPDASIVLAGSIVFPAIDSFIVTYTAPHPQDEAITSRYVKTYKKIR